MFSSLRRFMNHLWISHIWQRVDENIFTRMFLDWKRNRGWTVTGLELVQVDDFKVLNYRYIQDHPCHCINDQKKRTNLRFVMFYDIRL